MDFSSKLKVYSELLKHLQKILNVNHFPHLHSNDLMTLLLVNMFEISMNELMHYRIKLYSYLLELVCSKATCEFNVIVSKFINDLILNELKCVRLNRFGLYRL